MIDFNYIPGDSILHRTDPAVKFAVSILLSGLILLTKDLTCVIISILLVITLLILSGLDLESAFSPLKKIAIFMLMIFFVNALFYNGDSCIYAKWIICISKEGIRQGLNILLNTFMVIFLSSVFIRTTTSVEIIKGIETLLRPLRHLGVPTRDIALMMSIALQFIPVFFSDLDRIRKAQTARGADFSRGSILNRIKAVIPLVIPAFVSAFRRADELSMAIEARGYQCDKKT